MLAVFTCLFLTSHLMLNCVETSNLPTIEINATSMIVNGKQIFHFVCSSSIPTLACSIEFLINKKTYDDISMNDKVCHHNTAGNRICSPKICACSDNCQAFIRNITSTPDMTHHTFGCSARFRVGEDMFRATVSTKLIQKDFITFEQNSIPLIPSQTSSQVPTLLTGRSRENFSTVNIVIVSIVLVTALSSCIGCVQLLWMNAKRNKHKEQETTISTMEDLGNSAGFTRNPQPSPSPVRVCVPRQWTKSSPQLECSKQQDHVSYSNTKGERTSISTISASSLSLEKISFISNNATLTGVTRKNSYA